MNNVKRFSISQIKRHPLVNDDNGNLCLYSDYEKLEKELKKVNNRLENTRTKFARLLKAIRRAKDFYIEQASDAHKNKDGDCFTMWTHHLFPLVQLRRGYMKELENEWKANNGN